MVDVATSREIALVVDLALAQETEIITVKADAAEDPGQDQDQAALAATHLAMEEDITREATLLRETKQRKEAAAGPLKVASVLEATLAAIAEEILAHPLTPRAPAMIEDLSLPLEKLSPTVPLQINTRAPLRLLLPTAKLTRKNKLTEASMIFKLINDSRCLSS